MTRRALPEGILMGTGVSLASPSSTRGAPPRQVALSIPRARQRLTPAAHADGALLVDLASIGGFFRYRTRGTPIARQHSARRSKAALSAKEQRMALIRGKDWFAPVRRNRTPVFSATFADAFLEAWVLQNALVALE